jgi:uncharacterized protein (TIGR03084 family)
MSRSIRSVQAIITALAEQHAELDGLLDRLDDAGWARPTRCEGWDVADVVLHLAQTDELALASVEGRFDAGLALLAGDLPGASDVDAGAAAMVDRDRGRPNHELLERWRAAAAGLRQAVAAAEPRQRVMWVSGLLSVQTLAATRLSECWIHTGDVAGAIGVEQQTTDRLEHIARLAWRTVPYAFQRAGRELSGPVAFHLTGPSGANWRFTPDTPPATVITGAADELCNVAARRLPTAATSLRGEGPDAESVLELVRTYA